MVAAEAAAAHHGRVDHGHAGAIAPPAPLQPYWSNGPEPASCTPSVEEVPPFVVLAVDRLQHLVVLVEDDLEVGRAVPAKYSARHSM